MAFALALIRPIFMKHVFALAFLVFSSPALFSQSTADIGVWVDHLPYQSGIDLQEANGLVYVAAEQGLFIYDNAEKTIQRFSKVNGLSDVGITSIAWADAQQLLVIGYQNGNADLLIGERVRNVNDIRISGNFAGLKRINKVVAAGDLAYFCTDFGIVTYDLQTDIVRETWVIGDNGKTLAVNDLVLSPDSIFAATDEGLRVASRQSQLAFFGSWRTVPRFPDFINEVAWFDNKIFVNQPSPPVSDSVFFRESGQWQHAAQIALSGNRDLRESHGALTVCNVFSARAYRPNFSFVFNLSEDMNPSVAVLTPAGDQLFVADLGRALVEGFQIFAIDHTPNSLVSKNVLEMHHDGEKLLLSPGALSEVWGPQFNNDGLSILRDFSWENIENEEFEDYKDIVAMISDPADPQHIYAASYGNGILEFQDGNYIQIFNEATTNGAFPSIGGGGNHRVGGFSASPAGDIWFSNSLTDKPLGVIRADGTIESFSLGSATSSGTSVKDVLFTTQNQIWLQTRSEGIVVVPSNEEGEVIGSPRKLGTVEGQGNLPSNAILAFAEDLDGEIWIGTNEGMAVLYSPQNIFEPNRSFDAQIIVIDEDGDSAGERVLGAQIINDIEVDGSNKKWFATAGSGVFYTSANGKIQEKHFTRANSPLPSDNVLDIEINDVTGMVFFATDQGLVSYQGEATAGAESHQDVFAYPNPVEPGYSGPILIRGLVTNAQVKITDVEGNLVFETVAEGGQALWSGNKFNGERVTSGVYLAYITNDLGSQTAVAKILIVN